MSTKFGHLFFPIKKSMKYSLKHCIANADFRRGELYECPLPKMMEIPPHASQGMQVSFESFIKHIPDSLRVQIPSDVRILTVGFYA